MSGILQHLWQSTLFAAAIAGLAWLCRRNRASVRYSLWLAASVKFLIPFSLLVWAGSEAPLVPMPVAAPPVPILVEQILQPSISVAEAHTAASFPWTEALLAVWLCGALGVAVLYLRRLHRVRGVARAATPFSTESGVPILAAATVAEPGAYGILRPVILLPAGIERNLPPEQLRAVVAHELAHVRRRDNFTAALHMIVEAVFWFHPLVWWLSARLIEERERACDEEVLRLGSQPDDYAEGILNICKAYVESPVACISGVTGSDLKKRIETIMTRPAVFKLTLAKGLALAAAALLAVTVPFLAGVARAQQLLVFEVATIKLADSGVRPDGRVLAPIVTGGVGSDNPEQISYKGIWLMNLITNAYGVRPDEVTGPGWLSDQRYDVVAKIPPGTTKDQFAVMLQNLLRDRFHLTFHRKPEQRDVYSLVVGKKGHKLKPHVEFKGKVDGPIRVGGPDAEGFPTMPPNYVGTVGRPTPGRLSIAGQGVAVSSFTGWLRDATGRPVVDETGLTGTYDFKFSYARSAQRGTTGLAEPGADIFGAVEEQLGLKLENRNVPVEIIVIDTLERQPTEN